MVQRHKHNLQESLNLYDSCSEVIAKKECYMNIFNVIHRFASKFLTGEWKVAYGYIRILPDRNMMARHCFIVNTQGEAIDPTLVASTSLDRLEDEEYYSFKIFDSIDLYFHQLENNSYIPDFIMPLLHIDERIAGKWATKEGYVLIR